MPNPLAAIKSLLGGKIGKPSMPSSMSLGGPTKSTKDMLSRPSRPRRKGYKKTEVRPSGKPQTTALPDLGAALAMPPLGGGPGSLQ